MPQNKTLNIVTTIGTSVFENLSGKECIYNNYEKIKPDPDNNLKKAADSFYKDKRVSKGVENLDEYIGDIVDYTLEEEMAEVASINKIIEENENKYNNFRIVPICSDTAISVVAAKILKEYYKTYKTIKDDNIMVTVQFEYPYKNKQDCKDIYYTAKESEGHKSFIIKNLQVFDRDKFESEGLLNLFHALKSIYNESKKSGADLIFNITGGYKAIIPYMVIFAQVYEIPIYYKFEDSDNILKVPQLPVDLDLSIISENFTALHEIYHKDNNNLPTVEEFKEEYLPKGSADRLFKEFEEKHILRRYKGDRDKEYKVKLTFYGELLIERFLDKENRQSIVGLLIELQLFKYFVEECGDEIELIKHSYKIERDGRKNEIDLFVKFKNANVKTKKCIANGSSYDCICAEIKPAGNIPIRSNGKENSLEHSLTEGGLRKCFEMCRKNGIENPLLAICLYGTNDSLSISVKKQLNDLMNKEEISNLVNKDSKSVVRFYLIRLPSNYKNNRNWKILNPSIKDITEEIMNSQNNQTKGGN